MRERLFSTLTRKLNSCTYYFVCQKAEADSRDGTRIKITNLRAHLQGTCGELQFYIGILMDTDSTFDYLPIFSGDYILRIPLTIINNIESRTIRTKEGTYSFTNTRYKAALADDACFKRMTNKEFMTDFVGWTDLSDINLDPC